ncbi:hypothetical protein HZS61_004847 [Fusarium oxysporum f. sp. conglutinans]|uniref:GDP-mannose transporter n=1 Tax=Fusarium oxysporum f. sp. conglutinans TaxID=100902 RepID=A0A8H6LEE7_FUSOX|nr:hypothetical protein HZS61_004847 [Fusarium oxysporum f. sp. conglutinans]
MSPEADSKLYSIPEAASSSSSSTVDSPLQISKIKDDYDFGRRPSDFELNDLFHDEEPLLSEDIEAVREKEQEQQPMSRSSSSAMKSTFWTLVFTNKAILSGPSLKHAQLSFAAFHFTITGLVLFTLSRPRFTFFKPKSVAIRQMIPLSTVMALNVIFPNLSLAYSSVPFYQISRILITPCVAAMNFVLYRACLPFYAYKAPAQADLSLNLWVLILMSGIFAALVNVSQFFIIAEMGPVTSTVVAHGKTCIIVAIGWYISGRDVVDKCIIGLMVALLGIILYSAAILRQGP